MIKLSTLAAMPLCAALLAAPASAQDSWQATTAQNVPDRGEMHLQLVNNGEVDGFMRLGWQRTGDEIEIYDRTMLASGEIYETFAATIDANTFAPRDVSIRFHQQAAIMNIDTAVADGRVTGMRAVTHPLNGRQEAPVDMEIADGTILRGAAFLLAPYYPLDAGESVSFDWYAPLGNAMATVTVTAFDGGPVSTPAGDFAETLRLEVRGGSPENDIYVSTGETRQIVRIDVLGQDMRFELLPAPTAQ